MLYLSGKLRKLDLISVCLIIAAFVLSVTLIKSFYSDQIRQLKSETFMYKETLDRLKTKISLPRYPFATNYERKDYHDHEFIEMEALRDGPGEQGKSFQLMNYLEEESNKEVFRRFGFFVGASDEISVNRSLPDIRLPSCKTKKHLIELPQVSIVLVFFDEYWSILLRTLHSIHNRTPHDLLHEIILINDNSTLPELYEPLETYVTKNFNGIVTIHTMKNHIGLAAARFQGAKIARGEVIVSLLTSLISDDYKSFHSKVFLDAQVEVNVNWLPPLLEPIALNPKLITHPIIDVIAFDTFEYRKSDDGGRGIFNWDLQYRRFPRRPEDKVKLDEPIPSPVMSGTGFAVNRQNFFDLGAFDDGMKVYHGELLEFSMKAHLCGVGMVEVPCSRVGHSYRNKNYYKRIGDDGKDYMGRNFKRIAEVWLDEYSDVVFKRNPALYAEADSGDLTRPKTVKRGLHCKPFRYFLEFVATEMLERYPLEDPGCFAQGTIQSKSNPNLCIEVPKQGNKRQIISNDCEKNLIRPSSRQFFKLAWHRNIQHFTYDFCLQDNLALSECHFMGKNQIWRYDLITLQISQPYMNISRCLTLNNDNNLINLISCNSSDVNQRWNWGEKNVTALQNWESFGVDLSKLE